jgi:putative ABC transport system permease protein
MDSFMNETKLILHSQLQFYKRHPWVSLFFFLGLSLGSALISAINSLNTHAQNRYEDATSALKSSVSYIIHPALGNVSIPHDIWVQLSHAGITTQPVLEGQTKLNGINQNVMIKGINLLQWLKKNTDRETTNTVTSGQVFVDQQLSRKLQLDQNQTELTFNNAVTIKPLVVVKNMGPWILMDISYADHILQKNGAISFIEVGALSPVKLEEIRRIIKGYGRITSVANQEFDELSEAFFFNLKALAMLGYVVGLFLSYNALQLMLILKKPLIYQMSLLGCRPTTMGSALVLELCIIALFTAIVGNGFGYILSKALTFDINQTLISLYNLNTTLQTQWHWKQLLLGFFINISALSAILLGQQLPKNKMMTYIKYGIFLFAVGVAFILFKFKQVESSASALLLGALVIFIFAVCIIQLLYFLFRLPIHFKHPLIHWLKMSSQYHITDNITSILAVLVALAAAMSTQIMVDSFEFTLNNYLNQRLNADIYLRPNQNEKLSAAALEELPYLEKINPFLIASGQIDGHTATIRSYGDGLEHYDHIGLLNQAPITLAQLTQPNCLINEPAHLKYNYQVGDTVVFHQQNIDYECTISGVYYNYGEQYVQLIMDSKALESSGLRYQRTGYALNLKEADNINQAIVDLKYRFELSSNEIIQNKQLKTIANKLFSDTFAVTQAINSLMIIIALISIIVNVITMGKHQINRYFLLQALGVSLPQLWIIKMIQRGIMTSLTLIFTLPLGIMLGYILLDFVMPIAFGWSIPMQISWLNMSNMVILVVSAALLVAAAPLYSLLKKPISEGLR